VDTPYELAKLLGLTLSSHYQHTEDDRFLKHPENSGLEDKPNRILGMMCIKAMKEERPKTAAGDRYKYLWSDLFGKHVDPTLQSRPEKLEVGVVMRRASRSLQRAVMAIAGSAGVFTFSGRLRARATFSARHNTIFQGLAADGAKLALWRLWRAGYRIVNFIHDQVLIEAPTDSNLKMHAEQIRNLMIKGMKEVVPDVLVDVSFAATDRWHKDAEAVWNKKGTRLLLWHPEDPEGEAA
jgi:hypothetical protein